jgi:ribonuclease D
MNAPNSKSEHNHGGHHRLRRRRASHEAAITTQAAPAAVPVHPLIARDQPALLTDQSDLASLLDHVREVGLCAYDTEFIGELTYHPRLCLIQIGTPHRVAVIDAMADLDLTGIWEVLADSQILKIVHAGSQDLEPVMRHLGQPAANVFDTQLAAGLSRLPYPLSLTRLVEATLGLRLGKGLTFTSWDERPLSKAHLRYAADDVRYLPAVHQDLTRRLAELDHVELAMQECAAACNPDLYLFDPYAVAMRMRGGKSLSPKQLSVLIELIMVRDEAARTENIPPRALIKDEVLVDLARRHVTELDKLSTIRGLPRPVIQEFGGRLIEAIERGLATPKGRWPIVQDIEETASERFTIDALWTTVQATCFARGIDPAIVGTRQDIAEFWRHRHGGPTPSRQRITTGWRAQLIAQFIEEFTGGKRHIALNWADGSLHTS